MVILLLTCYFALIWGAKYCAQRVCLSLCLFVYTLTCLKDYSPNFTTCSLLVICGLVISVLLWGQCDALRTSSSVNAVCFHKWAESETTRMFCWVRQVAPPVGR